jgi:hypothetical protein
MSSKFFVFAALAVSCAVALPGYPSVDYYVRPDKVFLALKCS